MCELQEIAQMQLIHVNQRCPGDFSAPTAIHPAPCVNIDLQHAAFQLSIAHATVFHDNGEHEQTAQEAIHLSHIGFG